MKHSILKIASVALAILSSCSKSDDNTSTNPNQNELNLTKTEKVVAAPIRNISSYFWVTKSQSEDKFYIHNLENTANSSERGNMLYDLNTNTFSDKAKCINLAAAGYMSQLITGNSIYYIANEFNEYDPSTNTWTVRNDLFPNTIKNNHGEASGCVIGSLGKVFFIGGRADCKTVKYFNWTNNTWNFAADYPITINKGPMCASDNNSKTIYAVGGYSNGVVSKEFYKYTEATNTWTKLPDAPVTPVYSYTLRTLVLFKNNIIFLGDDSKLHIFNIASNQWQTNTIDTAGIANLGAHLETSTDGNKFYILYRKSNGSLGIQEYQ